ncbi:MAG: TRAP transporter TatT component family protein [Polyangiales bacterium]
MMRSLNIGHWVALVSMAALVASCGSTRETAWDTTSKSVQLDDAARAQVAQLMADADAAWANRGDPDQVKAAIDAWTKASEIDPTNAKALSELSHAIYFYADCHLRFDEDHPDTYKNTHEQGTRAAERALSAMSPAFAEKMASGARIEDAIPVLNASAVPALYWRSSNLGRWAKLDSFATLLSYKDEIRAVMEFCLDEDPLYWYQGPDRYFGVFYAVAPSFAGGDMKKSAAHFNVAIDAHPNYFGTRILMAEEWAVKEDNRPLFEELVNYVLAGDPNVIPEIVPENTCEQRKARKLMDQIDDLF